MTDDHGQQAIPSAPEELEAGRTQPGKTHIIPYSLSLMPWVRNRAWAWADGWADPVSWLQGFGIHMSDLFPQ